MRLPNWLRPLASRAPRTPHRAGRPAGRSRPRLEALEDRCLMAALISGPAQVAAGAPYALNLTTNEAVTQWNVNWGDPRFTDLGQWTTYVGRGSLQPEDRRVFDLLSRDSRYELVYLDKKTLQAVFRHR